MENNPLDKSWLSCMNSNMKSASRDGARWWRCTQRSGLTVVPILLATCQKPLTVGWGEGSPWSMVSSALCVPRCDQHTPHVVLCEEEPDQGEAKGPSPDFMHLWVSVDGPQLPGWDLCSWLQKEWQWEGQFPARRTSYSQAEEEEARQTHFCLRSRSGSFCWLLPDP